MTATRLAQTRVEKPWGRHILWPGFADPAPNALPVGEIWFGESGAGALMVKYIFTSKRLSIQVHPDDAQARAAGHASGKDEAWVILAAEADSTIALGTIHPVARDALRAAALDGSIEGLMDWKPVKAGDVIYSPAGTVHAIGAGITLIEIQQSIDLTYRLYDYGRPRELHLDAGIAVSDPVPFAMRDWSIDAGPGRTILAHGGKFVLERWRWNGEHGISLPRGVPAWFVPVAGAGTLDGQGFAAGECWMIDAEAQIRLDEASDILFAYPLADPIDMFD